MIVFQWFFHVNDADNNQAHLLSWYGHIDFQWYGIQWFWIREHSLHYINLVCLMWLEFVYLRGVNKVNIIFFIHYLILFFYKYNKNKFYYSFNLNYIENTYQKI